MTWDLGGSQPVLLAAVQGIYRHCGVGSRVAVADGVVFADAEAEVGRGRDGRSHRNLGLYRLVGSSWAAVGSSWAAADADQPGH